MKAKRIGDLMTVANKNKKFAANTSYKYLRVQDENNDEFELLFTENEIRIARERALKNPEDLPTVGWLRNLLD